MQKNKLNNVIVLKEIHSNIVEEAIVVLKPHVDLKQNANMDKSLKDEQIDSRKKTIIKEAEYVIENYISQMQIKNKQIKNEKTEKKCKFLKRVIISLCVINFFLVLKLF